MPVFTIGKSKKEYDRRKLCDISNSLKDDEENKYRVVIEQQQTMPGQGAVSGYTIGYGYGLLVMAFEGKVPYSEVRPMKWKKDMGLVIPTSELKGMSARVKKKRLKELSLREAQRLFPDESFIPEGCRKANCDMAEAALLAVYGKRKGF